jgi:crotonobetainyl-CoA:carnitine CoA-transferase CaiB-like acyl-CoA transferase
MAAREKTGRGQFVDAAMMDAAISMLPLVAAMVAGGEPAPSRGRSMLNGGQPVYGVYETQDAKFVTIGAIEPKFWKKFCALVQRPDLEVLHFDTGKGGDRLRAELTALFKTRTRAQWMDLLEEQDVCAGPVLDLDEAMKDPHALARGMIVDVDTRSGKVPQTGAPIKFSDTPASFRLPPPEFGEHTAEVLALAGVDAAELEQLQKQGVV